MIIIFILNILITIPIFIIAHHNFITLDWANHIDRTLASKYNQKPEDIQEWLLLTKWSQKPLEEKVLNNIQNQLFDLKIIDKKGTFAEIVKAV